MLAEAHLELETGDKRKFPDTLLSGVELARRGKIRIRTAWYKASASRPFVLQLGPSAGSRGATSTGFVGVEGGGGSRGPTESRWTVSWSPPSAAKLPPLARIVKKIAGGARSIRWATAISSFARARRWRASSCWSRPTWPPCPECFADFTDPANRRFGYAFTNCTNCGPRYTIIRDIPYDRPNTTMAGFRMCEACQAEYDDPGDRRFHAQPNACPSCGPQLSAPIAEAQQRLSEGAVVAIRGLGGFHLACDPRNDAAVRLLRERKRRSDKPFALMARDLDAVEAFCTVSDDDRRALLSPRRPIVILPRREESGLSAALAPGNNTIGVMLPYTPLHHLLFADAPYDALVMTSGNLSEEPIVTSNEDALRRLRPLADWFLMHDREIYMRADDSVVRAHLRGPGNACCAGRADLRAASHRPGYGSGRDSGLRRRTEERLLPEQGTLRPAEPAHRRYGELRNAGLLRGDASQFEKALPCGTACRGARFASGLPEHPIRAAPAGSGKDRRATCTISRAISASCAAMAENGLAQQER